MSSYRCFSEILSDINVHREATALLELLSSLDISEAATSCSITHVENWIQDKSMPPILYYICDKISLDKLKWLIKHCPSVTSTDTEGTTALMRAVSKANVNAVVILLQAGLDVAQIDTAGDNALFHAIGRNYLTPVSDDYRKIALLLLEAGTSTNIFNSDRSTPLHVAITSAPDLDMISLLLSHNADVTATDLDGNTPLILACRNPSPINIDLITMLVTHGSDCNHQNAKGDTPLTTFVDHYHRRISAVVAYLINHGADFMHKNLAGESIAFLFHYGQRRYYIEEIISLVECPDKKAQLIHMTADIDVS